MKRRLMILVVAAFACFAVPSLTADGPAIGTSLEVEGDYQFPNHEATDTSGFAPIVYGTAGGTDSDRREAGSAWGAGELKGIIDRSLVFPFLKGGTALTKDNNLALDFSGEVSPISLNANFKATLTPVAFLKLAVGAGIGTGWSELGFIGLAINDLGTMEPQNFGGIVYRAWVEGTFQFDLAAFFPGEWNHVVLLASPKVEYQAYTGADANTPWMWEADDGMNFNGWQLYCSYFIGYQMPIALDTVGLLLQTQGWFGTVREKSTEASGGWGSDFTYLTFGPIFDFRIDKKSSIAILPQFKTGLQWSDVTKWNLDFQKRSYQDAYLYFYRIAFDYNLKL
jgi:hypothetical protein